MYSYEGLTEPLFFKWIRVFNKLYEIDVDSILKGIISCVLEQVIQILKKSKRYNLA